MFDCLFTNIPLSVSSKSFVPKSGTSGFLDLINNQPTAKTPKATKGFILPKKLNAFTALNTFVTLPTAFLKLLPRPFMLYPI